MPVWRRGLLNDIETIAMGDRSERSTLLSGESHKRRSHHQHGHRSGSGSDSSANGSSSGESADSVSDNVDDEHTAPYPPSDRFYCVYMIFYLLGVGSLLPWNFFSIGRQYFLYKLRNVSATNESNYDVPAFETRMQSTFENYLTIAAMLPNVVFLFLNTATTRLISSKVRIVVSSLLMIAMFAVTMALTKVATDDWQGTFFTITIVTIIIMNAASAVFQGAIFGLSSRLPKEYSQSVMAGMGMGGTIAALANIVSLSAGSGPVESGFGYFLTALLVLLLALLGYLTLPLSHFARHYSAEISLAKSVHLNDQEIEIYKEIESKKIPLLAVFQKVWQTAFCVFFIYFVSLSCYPAINSAIRSEQFDPKLHRPWADKYFEPVGCFLLFNFSDFLGRTFAGIFQYPSGSRASVTVFALLRVVFIFVFVFCNVQPRAHLPVLFHWDWVPIVAGILFGLSNGYLSTVCMMYGPRLVSVENMEMAGSMLSFFIALGLGVGSIFSLLLRIII